MKKKVMRILLSATLICALSSATTQACTAWRASDSRTVCRTPLCNGKDLGKYRETVYVRDCKTAAGSSYTESKTESTYLGCCY